MYLIQSSTYKSTYIYRHIQLHLCAHVRCEWEKFRDVESLCAQDTISVYSVTYVVVVQDSRELPKRLSHTDYSHHVENLDLTIR